MQWIKSTLTLKEIDPRPYKSDDAQFCFGDRSLGDTKEDQAILETLIT